MHINGIYRHFLLFLPPRSAGEKITFLAAARGPGTCCTSLLPGSKALISLKEKQGFTPLFTITA